MYCDLLLYKGGYENSPVKIKEIKKEFNQLQKNLWSKELNQQTDSDKKIAIELLNEMIEKCQKKIWETDEWISILSYLNITKEDIENNVPNNKLFEAIELLN